MEVRTSWWGSGKCEFRRIDLRTSIDVVKVQMLMVVALS